MKLIAVLMSLLSVAITNSAMAQITPDVDFKGGIYVKTDPVLRPETAFVKTDPVLRPETAFVKTDPVLDPAGFSLNFQPVLELISLLEAKGAKIESRIEEIKGLVVLKLKVDGKQIQDTVIECKGCIKYEY